MEKEAYENVVYLSLGRHNARAITYACPLVKRILIGDELRSDPPFFTPDHQNIFWLELFGQNPKSSLIFHSNYLRSHSLVESQMAALPHTYPACKQKPEVVADFKHQLRARLKKDYPDDLKSGIIPTGLDNSKYEGDFPWFVLKTLDQLKHQHPIDFSVETEVHSLNSLEEFTELWDRRDHLKSLSDEGCRGGNTTAATSFLREHIATSAKYLTQRNGEIAEQIGRLLETSSLALPIYLFVRIGNAHLNLPHYLERMRSDALKHTRIVSRFDHEVFFNLGGQIKDHLRLINEGNNEGFSLTERLIYQLEIGEIGINELNEETMLKAILDHYVYLYFNADPSLFPSEIRKETDYVVSNTDSDQIKMLIKRMSGKTGFNTVIDFIKHAQKKGDKTP